MEDGMPTLAVLFLRNHPKTTAAVVIGKLAVTVAVAAVALMTSMVQVCQSQQLEEKLIAAPDPVSTKSPTPASDNTALQVNWLYGAFVPKDVPMEPLNGQQRWKLYTRMTYTTYGIYIKTGLFTMSDQIKNIPPEWGKTAEGFGKRLGTREAQFVIQNSLTALGDAAVGWEPRYDRCRCDRFWPRTWHAIARNFVTYGGANQSLRPQIMPYAGAFGAAVTAAS
jgi:hypothetical protein